MHIPSQILLSLMLFLSTMRYCPAFYYAVLRWDSVLCIVLPARSCPSGKDPIVLFRHPLVEFRPVYACKCKISLVSRFRGKGKANAKRSFRSPCRADSNLPLSSPCLSAGRDLALGRGDATIDPFLHLRSWSRVTVACRHSRSKTPVPGLSARQLTHWRRLTKGQLRP